MNIRVFDTTMAWAEQEITRGIRTARKTGKPCWIAATLSLPPMDLISAFARATDYGFLSQSREGGLRLGLGIAKEWSWQTPEGWRNMEAIISRLRLQGLPGFLWVTGGHAFSPPNHETPWANFPANLFVLPRLQIDQTADEAIVTLVSHMMPDDTAHEHGDPTRLALGYLFSEDPGHEAPMPAPSATRMDLYPRAEPWMAMIKDATDAIAMGSVDKIVLAREIVMHSDRPIAVAEVLRHLRLANPEAHVFGIKRGDTAFVGATPELLAEVQGETVHTMCLAGSTPRGMTPEQDALLARELEEHSKDRDEHESVRHHVRTHLELVAHDIQMPATPTLKKLPTVQHLHTPVTAVLDPGQSLWSLLEVLTPTPAVAGSPVPAATQWILEHEPFQRGWYAGAIGSATLSGDGTFHVALRSGLIRGATAYLYAGCGIMAHSDPAQELKESRWKFRTMLEALELEGVEPDDKP